MNKSDLRNFTINARLELLRRVRERAVFYGVDEKSCAAGGFVPSDRFQRPDGAPLSAVEIAQRDALLRRVLERGYAQTMEEAAYTWFNRFAALRYMQAHNRLPISVRVLPDAPGEAPQLLREAQDVELPGADMGRVLDMLSASDADGLYKYLLIALCNALSEPLPGMFEQISDETELLFPDGLLRADSMLGEMAKLDADSWNEIQVVGWLYQYYISEKHDEVVNINGSSVKKEDIPAATCLYTTDWVVKYMVENSLGRLWLEGHPDANLRMKWRYYMDEAEQTPEVAAKLAEIRQGYAAMRPEDIKLLDPCMGSGHILVYAFDVLMEIYRSVGYTDRDAARSIVENNLYGLDIDDRAAQLAYFAVMMKACEYDRRFLKRGVQPHVCAIRESSGMPQDAWNNFAGQKNTAQALYRAFEHGKDFGSLIAPEVTLQDLTQLESQMEEMTRRAEYADLATRATVSAALASMLPLMEQARILVQRYDAVVTNPPYLNKYNKTLKDFVQNNYPDSKSDLFSVFMTRNFALCKENGYSAFMTPFVWMFIKSYEKLREYIIQRKSITTLIQMEYSAFEEATVPICTFVLRNSKMNYAGNYLRLSDFKGGMAVQDEKVLEAQNDLGCKYHYIAQQENFKKIPGMPVAYWVSGESALLDTFSKGTLLDSYALPKQGMSTCDVNRYTRLWQEVDIKNTNLINTKKRDGWIKYNKGGAYRRWYGNQEYLVYWGGNGSELIGNGALLRNRDVYFQSFMAWTKISSAGTGFRLFGEDFLFDGAGGSLFVNNSIVSSLYLLGLLNSKIATLVLNLISPTLNYNENHIGSIPVLLPLDKDTIAIVEQFADSCVCYSKCDWDSFETSWDFQQHPFIRWASNMRDATSIACTMEHYYGCKPEVSCPLELCFLLWQGECNERFNRLKANEEELNRIFIDIYGLQGELTPEVADRDVTVYRIIDNPNEEERKMAYVRSMRDEIVSLLSYIVGCMLGRYSPYVDGLLYAGGEWNYEAIVERIAVGAKDCDFYDSSLGLFLPDRDGIVPVTDDEYFADDVVTRTAEFVKKVYGAQTLEENLKFIADALGNKGDSPREVIRNYYLNDFYKDHLKTYQKRPIYWQFDSGKQNGFKCLMYLHRYDRDSVARVRTDYVHEQQERLRTQLDDARKTAETAEGRMRANAVKRAQKLEKQLAEVNQYEEIVHHYADMRLEIDLDDGVKVNYAKLADLLTKIK